MADGSLFGWFWMGGVFLVGVVHFAWAINDLRLGSARLSWYSARVQRPEEPFEYWLAVGGKLAVALVVAPSMLWFGSGVAL